MTHCGSCQHIRIGAYPKHESLGMFRCTKTGSFYTLTRPIDCAMWQEVANLDGRRELVRKLTKAISQP